MNWTDIKNKAIQVIMPFVIIAHFSIQAQEINGRWMQIRIPNSISYPTVNIIEIADDSIFAYDFKKLYEKNKIEIRNNTFYLGDTIAVNFSFIKKNTFEIKSQNHKDREVSHRFVKLSPTKDTLNLVNSLKNNTYSISFSNQNLTFKVGDKKAKGNAIVIGNPPMVTDEICIEKFEETYFLCLYLLNRLGHAFPIKEVQPDALILYGLPNFENDIVAKRIN